MWQYYGQNKVGYALAYCLNAAASVYCPGGLAARTRRNTGLTAHPPLLDDWVSENPVFEVYS